MPRTTVQIKISDLSDFTKTLRRSIKDRETFPSHATMLSLVAKAAGYGNYQHLKAAKTESTAKTGYQLTRAQRVFDHLGIMHRWPKQRSVQGLCLWVFWADLPARTDIPEKEVNAVMNARHSFGDHALLRRSLIDHRMITRTTDGKIYRRIEREPPEEALTLIRSLGQRPS